MSENYSVTELYDDDPIIRGLRKLGHWSSDTPAAQIWADVKIDLQRQPPAERANGIRNLEKGFGDGEIPLNRDSARTFMHLREARDIHEMLLKSGR